MASRARTRPTGYFVAVLIASCAPFAANTGDGGGATGDASGGSDSGPGALDSAVFNKQDGGFCGTFSDAIECFDFDEMNPPMGLTLGENGGTNTFQPTFDGGSPPNALVVTTTIAGGRATATAAPIIFVAHPNATITIAFRFYVSAPATSVEYIARLNFTQQSSPIALNSANGLQCGGIAVTSLAPGGHAISLSMAVDGTGSVTSYTCTLDASTGLASPVQASKTLLFELGNQNSGSGKFTVSYDNVVIRVP